MSQRFFFAVLLHHYLVTGTPSTRSILHRKNFLVINYVLFSFSFDAAAPRTASLYWFRALLVSRILSHPSYSYTLAKSTFFKKRFILHTFLSSQFYYPIQSDGKVSC